MRLEPRRRTSPTFLPYDRWGVVEMAPVMEAIGAYLKDPTTSPRKVEFLGVEVEVSGLRLQTFFESPPCCSDPSCPHKPSFFAIERTPVPEGRSPHSPHHRYHLNLYGRDAKGREILFTHDHTLARGLGGSDTRDNTTMMCWPCNRRKSIIESKLANRRRRIERGEDPEVIGEPSEKKVIRQRKLLEDEARHHGMELEKFIEHCDTVAMRHRQGQRIAMTHGESRRKIAKALGMTLEGYIQLRHMHNERMLAQLPTPRKVAFG